MPADRVKSMRAQERAEGGAEFIDRDIGLFSGARVELMRIFAISSEAVERGVPEVSGEHDVRE